MSRLDTRTWVAIGIGTAVTAGAVVVVAQPFRPSERPEQPTRAAQGDPSAGSRDAIPTDSGVWSSQRPGPWEPGSGWSDAPASGVDLSEHLAEQRAQRAGRPEGGFWAQIGEGERFNWREMSEADRAAFRERMQEMREERRAAFVAQFDLDGDGVLNDEERAAMEAHLEEQRERGRELRQQFVDRFDLDGDGRLSRTEAELARETIMGEVRAARNLERLAEGGQMLSPDQLAMGLTMIQEGDLSADFNGDGVVDHADAQRLIDAFNAGELPIDPMLRQAQRIMMAEMGRGGGGGERRFRMRAEGEGGGDAGPRVIIFEDGEPRPARRGGEPRPARNPE